MLLSNIESIEIIDITHSIRLDNTIEAAFVFKQLKLSDNHQYINIFKLGAARKLLVYQHLLNLYILPNNGLIGMIFETINYDSVYMIDAGDEIKAIDAYRHGKIDSLPKAGKDIRISLMKQAQVNGSLMIGECIFTDRHGNCYFNVTRRDFEEFTSGKNFEIRIQHYTGHAFRNICESIDDIEQGDAAFRFNASDYLKLQINMGSAKQLFRIKDETKIMIEIL